MSVCVTCDHDPCDCVPEIRALSDWSRTLSQETLARAYMVLGHLPCEFELEREEAYAEVRRIEALQPKHLGPSELLELYLLELIEALKREREQKAP
jgi:hypothetical protein